MNSTISPSEQAKTNKGKLSQHNIIVATRKILADQDLSSLKLDDVAALSGIAKSSVLWHFGSKNGLLLAVVDSIFSDIQTLLLQFTHEDNSQLSIEAQLKHLMSTLAQEMQKTPEANALLIAFIVNKTLDKTIIQQVRLMYQNYRGAISEQLFIRHLSFSTSMATTLLAIIDGVYLQWYLEPDNINLEQTLVASIDHIKLS